MIKVLTDDRAERMTAHRTHQSASTSKEGEGNGGVGGRSAGCDLLAWNRDLYVTRREVIHRVDDVDGREAHKQAAIAGAIHDPVFTEARAGQQYIGVLS